MQGGVDSSEVFRKFARAERKLGFQHFDNGFDVPHLMAEFVDPGSSQIRGRLAP